MDNNTNQPAVGKETVEQEDKQKKRLQNVLEYAESLALVFAVMLLIFTFIARPATVDGESMLPTLENGNAWSSPICSMSRLREILWCCAERQTTRKEKTIETNHRDRRTDGRHRL